MIKIETKQLQEGAILAQPVITPLGQPLAPAGSAVTRQLINRMKLYRVDELKEHRLDVPQATLVADELRSAGVPIPQGILTRKELVDAIMSVANA